MNDDVPLRRRLYWFVLLWCASVAGLGLVAWVIRSILLA
ncbi:MAG TPA: DUF2474 family protein [Steroidobacteraceae bacterium]|nr:DUF2474 family protein [Steroidobacteraceae bacterium]